MVLFSGLCIHNKSLLKNIELVTSALVVLDVANSFVYSDRLIYWKTDYLTGVFSFNVSEIVGKLQSNLL